MARPATYTIPRQHIGNTAMVAHAPQCEHWPALMRAVAAGVVKVREMNAAALDGLARPGEVIKLGRLGLPSECMFVNFARPPHLRRRHR